VRGKGAEALFFLAVIALGFGYVFFRTAPESLQEVKSLKKISETQILLAEIKATARLLYRLPLSPFTRMSDFIFNQPAGLMAETINLATEAVKIEERKALTDQKIETLNYYMEQFLEKKQQNRKISFESIMKEFVSWIKNAITLKGDRPESLKDIFNINPSDTSRKKALRAIKKLLAETRREAASLQRKKLKIISRARQKNRLAILFSVSVMTVSVFLAGSAIAVFFFARRFFIRDHTHATALVVENKKTCGYLRLKKAEPDKNIIARAKNEGWYCRSAMEVISILSAYRQWPASINGHLSREGGLYEHSFFVLGLMLEQAKEGMDRREIALIALSHDLGKLLTYRKNASGWEKTGMYHDVLSGAIIKEMDLSEFSEDAARRIVLVVSHHHNAADLPINVPSGTRELLELLMLCDGMAARKEKNREVNHGVKIQNTNQSQHSTNKKWGDSDHDI